MHRQARRRISAATLGSGGGRVEVGGGRGHQRAEPLQRGGSRRRGGFGRGSTRCASADPGGAGRRRRGRSRESVGGDRPPRGADRDHRGRGRGAPTLPVPRLRRRRRTRRGYGVGAGAERRTSRAACSPTAPRSGRAAAASTGVGTRTNQAPAPLAGRTAATGTVPVRSKVDPPGRSVRTSASQATCTTAAGFAASISPTSEPERPRALSSSYPAPSTGTAVTPLGIAAGALTMPSVPTQRSRSAEKPWSSESRPVIRSARSGCPTAAARSTATTEAGRGGTLPSSGSRSTLGPPARAAQPGSSQTRRPGAWGLPATGHR